MIPDFTLTLLEEKYPWPMSVPDDSVDSLLALFYHLDHLIIKVLGLDVPPSASWVDFLDTAAFVFNTSSGELFKKLQEQATLIDEFDLLGQRLRRDWEAAAHKESDPVVQKHVVRVMRNRIRKQLFAVSNLKVKTEGGRFIVAFMRGGQDVYKHVTDLVASKGARSRSSRFAGVPTPVQAKVTTPARRKTELFGS